MNYIEKELSGKSFYIEKYQLDVHLEPDENMQLQLIFRDTEKNCIVTFPFPVSPEYQSIDWAESDALVTSAFEGLFPLLLIYQLFPFFIRPVVNRILRNTIN